MTILAPVRSELFTVRVYKHLDIAAGQFWANSYEFETGEGASFADLRAAGQAVVEFERLMSHDTVVFDRVVTSTLVEDGQPYDPEAFISDPLGGLVGNVTSPPTANVLPLQVALFLRREVTTGRTGKLFLRQTVSENDVSGRYGSYVLTDPAAMEARYAAAVGVSNIDSLFASGESPMNMCMVGGTTTRHIRRINGLTPVDARLIKYNNRYFDRR
jgi:hypothetical protein